MTGTPKVKPPTNDAEWARTVEQRLRGAEHPSSVRMGKWVLTTDENDNLLGAFANGGSVVLAVPPEVDNDEADVVETGTLYKLKAARSATQAAGTISWDTVLTEIGEWGVSPGTPFTDVVIPRTGFYLIVADVHCSTRTDDECHSVVTVNGTNVLVNELSGEVDGNTASASAHNHASGSLNVTWGKNMLMSAGFALNVGDVVRVVTTNTGNIGPSAVVGATAVVTTLTLIEMG